MRLTQIRKKIILFFKKQKKPISYDKIIDYLKKNSISFDRSTVFRNLNFLEKEGVIKKLNFGDGVSRYELVKENDYHHHIVCLNCKKIVDFSDKDLDDLIRKIEIKFSKTKKFRIKSHQFDFFGYCQNCS